MADVGIDWEVVRRRVASVDRNEPGIVAGADQADMHIRKAVEGLGIDLTSARDIYCLLAGIILLDTAVQRSVADDNARHHLGYVANVVLRSILPLADRAGVAR